MSRFGRSPLVLRLGGPVVLVLVVLLLALSWSARTIHRITFEMPGHEGWLTVEPDSAYHMRRVLRVFDEGLPVAERDDYMNAPEGAFIPWPPYYTLVAAAFARPGLPAADPGRSAHVERVVASLPRLFGTAATLVAILAAGLLAGRTAGVAAGATHALCWASIHASRLGNGDHHAWIELLGAGALTLTSWSLGAALDHPRSAARRGAVTGAVLGLAIGSWVASLLYLVYVDLVLGWLLVRQARAPRAGLAAFGLALHVSALVVLAPAVATSPWTDASPWIVVNLSWFHPAFLAVGALVFLPLVLRPPSTTLSRRYPWIVALVFLFVGGALFAFDAGPAQGIAQGFDWIGRTDAFVANVGEGMPLIGPGSPPFLDTLEQLGYGLLGLVPIWAWMAWRGFARGESAFLPWVVALPLLAVQALSQGALLRALAVPLAVAVGWGLSLGLRALASRSGKEARRPRWAVPMAVLLALALEFPTLASTALRGRSDLRATRNNSPRKKRAPRELYDWLRAAPRGEHDAVLANWSFGHAIEFFADRPSVATNFGTYVGEDGYRAPGRFFLSEDQDEAEALLEAHTARYVLVTSSHMELLPALLQTVPERSARYLIELGSQQARLGDDWYRTMGASLLADGRPRAKPGAAIEDSLGFLRLVHISPVPDPKAVLPWRPSPVPSGWIWEHVRGAILEARAPAGTALRVTLELVYPGDDRVLVFDRQAKAGPGGRVRLRVPYATTEPNGDGVVRGEPLWQLGTETGPLALAEADVRTGRIFVLP